jgi:hypothetical protein
MAHSVGGDRHRHWNGNFRRGLSRCIMPKRGKYVSVTASKNQFSFKEFFVLRMANERQMRVQNERKVTRRHYRFQNDDFRL